MASTTRSSSFLPSIKCSNCNASIEISLMADHLCSTVPPLPEPRLQTLAGPIAPPASNLPSRPPLLQAGRMLPPRIDASVANQPLLPTKPFGPNGSTGNLRSASPAPYGNGRRSTYRIPPRSATSPLPSRPLSPDVSISQDCAFPPFPTSKSRSATPTTPVEMQRPFPFDKRKPEEGQTDLNASFAPLSPRGQGGGSVLQRMNTIAPGPFHMRDQGDYRHSGHKRTATMSSGKDYIRPPSAGSGKGHAQRPSTASSNYTRSPSLSSTFTRNLSLSSISGGPRSTLSDNLPAMPALPVLRKPSRPGDNSNPSPSDQPTQLDRPFEMLKQENRSQTFPADGRDSMSTENSNIPFHRRPSEPTASSHKARPSVAAAIRPLHEIGSTSSFKPSRSVRGRTASTAPEVVSSGSNSRAGGRIDPRFEDAPPLPLSTRVQEFSIGNPYHAATESTSSNESSGSDRKSGSSRSTPPLSNSPQRPKRRSSDMQEDGSMMDEFQRGLTGTPKVEEKLPRSAPPPSFSRPMYSRPNVATPRQELAMVAPDTRATDPAIQKGRPLTILQPPDGFFDSVAPIDHLRLSPMPPPPARRPTTANKGKCRGCEELIKGKSVSSADGRLTGRYHRQCFVCKTCKAPFQTADFYVISNHPYCERHYHQLNGSLCKDCDRGIEGQYLETELKQKFHPHCFTCQDCRRILCDDYFEMNGKTYCEQHAFRAAQQTSTLGPGRRHPERRTTRLMMM